MVVHYDLEGFEKVSNPVVTIGSFDGVHVGHQKILKKLVKTAADENGESVLFSFYPHPRQVLFADNYSHQCLNTQKEKIELVSKQLIDHLIFFPFTREFSQKTFKEFVAYYLLEKIHLRKIIIGYDYHFGKNREGNYQNLVLLSKEFGFEVEQIDALGFNDTAVSSTKTREALNNGNIKLANNFLGYDYTLSGKVVKGNQIGRQLGFPTANMVLEETCKLIPAFGVYAVKVNILGATYKGMLNIGIRPTLDLSEVTIEVNIFDFDKDIYGENITICMVERIRAEEKFSGLAALKEQLAKDKASTLKILQ